MNLEYIKYMKKYKEIIHFFFFWWCEGVGIVKTGRSHIFVTCFMQNKIKISKSNTAFYTFFFFLFIYQKINKMCELHSRSHLTRLTARKVIIFTFTDFRFIEDELFCSDFFLFG